MTVTHAALIGRQAELDQLGRAFATAAAGHPAFVLVVGEAGIGKTELLRAASATARDLGLRVLTGSAIESGSAIPFLPLLAPLADAIADGSQDPAAATVGRMVRGDRTDPGVGRRSPGAGGSGGDREPAVDVARLIESMFDVLTRRPTALVVDDVHWADQSTLTVLDYLAGRAADVPLVVIAAARDDEERLAQLPIADGRRYTQLAVRRLTRDEVGRQIAELLGHAPRPDVADGIYERSAGNPLFVEELVAADRHAGHGTSPGSNAAGVSVALRALVLGRVGRLSDPARRSVEALAILGRTAVETLVAEVAGLAPEDAPRALDEAVRGGIAVSMPAGFELRHPVMGEVVAENLAGSVRRDLHRRAAEALERAAVNGSSAGGTAELARHWTMAGDRSRAWSASLTAADDAERGLAFAEARTLLGRALELWPIGTSGIADVRLRTATAAWMTGDSAAALTLAREAEAEVIENPGPDQPSLLEVFVAQGRYAWDAGERHLAVRAFGQAAAGLNDDTPPVLRARALWGIGRGRIGEGRYADAYDVATAAAAAAAQANHLAWEGEAWLLAGMSRAWHGADGIAEIERGLGLAVRSEHPDCTAHAYQFLVDLLGLAGRGDEALELARRGIETADRQGLARTHGSDLRGRAGLLLLERGRWGEGDEILAPADPRAFPSLARAMLAARRGQFAEADAALADAAVGGAIGGPGALGGWLELARTELAWLRGDVGTARRELASLRVPVGVWEPDAAGWQMLWAARLDPAGEPGDDLGSVPPHADKQLRGALDTEVAAERATALDRGRAHAWARAVEAWTAMGRPYGAAWASLRQAEAGFAGNDRVMARNALREASLAADRLGAAPLRERAEDLARRSRVSARPVRRHTPDPSELTERERDVLDLLAEGRTNRQIAERLFLSPKTVGIHVSRILDKLAAATRGEAVASGRRRGLLD